VRRFELRALSGVVCACREAIDQRVGGRDRALQRQHGVWRPPPAATSVSTAVSRARRARRDLVPRRRRACGGVAHSREPCIQLVQFAARVSLLLLRSSERTLEVGQGPHGVDDDCARGNGHRAQRRQVAMERRERGELRRKACVRRRGLRVLLCACDCGLGPQGLALRQRQLVFCAAQDVEACIGLGREVAARRGDERVLRGAPPTVVAGAGQSLGQFALHYLDP
jgi:hypothetical protein